MGRDDRYRMRAQEDYQSCDQHQHRIILAFRRSRPILRHAALNIEVEESINMRARIRLQAAIAAALLATCTVSGAMSAAFSIESPTIKPGATLSSAQVFNGMGCSGKNISPALQWQDAPGGTK